MQERRTERYQERQQMLEGATRLGDVGWSVGKLIESPGGSIYLEFIRTLPHHRSTNLNDFEYTRLENPNTSP